MASTRRVMLLAVLCLSSMTLSACGPSMEWRWAIFQDRETAKQCIDGGACKGYFLDKDGIEGRDELSRVLLAALNSERLARLEVVEYLLAEGSDPNYLDPEYAWLEPPVCALVSNRVEGGSGKRVLRDEEVLPILKALEKAGARLDDQCRYDHPFVQVAIESDLPGVRAYVLARNPKLTPSVADKLLETAVRMNDLELVAVAARSASPAKVEGYFVDCASHGEAHGMGCKPETRDALCDHVDVRGSIRGGRSVTIQGESTALDFIGSMSSRNKKLGACVQKLLSRGADVSSEGRERPLLCAMAGSVKDPDPVVVRMLLEKGADPNARDQGGRGPTALEWAVQYDLDPLVDVLLEHKADPNLMREGVTAFGWAVSAGKVRSVEKMLAHGADPLKELSHGWTPLQYAIHRGDPEILRMVSSKVTREALREAEARVRARKAQVAAAQPVQPAAGPGEPAAPAGPARRPRPLAPAIVAVFDVEARGLGLQRAYLDGLTELLAMQLVETGFFQVVPREDLKRRLLDAKSNSYKACFDQSCQIELGRELAAEKTLSVKVVKLGSRCSASLALFDLKRATAESAATAQGACGEDDLPELLKQLVDKLTR